MKVELVEGACLVSRPAGAPALGNEITFWRLVQRELNAGQTQPRMRWFLFYPDRVALTSMPYALRQGPESKRLHVHNPCIIDNYYALRDVAKQYNDGLTVRLTRITLERIT